ncbi:MAG: alpha/beta hydrolase [Oscillospiraceae bacterium]|nr:alpha/beta hydrolase [Oscillospiraceae bacterium]
MRPLKRRERGIRKVKTGIDGPGGKLKLIVLRYGRGPGILWIHGGGYALGTAGMVYASMGRILARRFCGTVVSPEYRLAGQAPYPAALEDCWAALKYMYESAGELGIDRKRIVVGGESAGGGLAAALCLYARDRGEIPIAFQIPLYPMLDCEDTDSSRDNHGHVWNTKRNHWGWSKYLGGLYGTAGVPPYASPARAEDLSRLPPCYTYVEDGEPFYDETLAYVRKLNEAGVEAHADVFHGKTHAFDALFWTRNAREAKKKLIKAAEKHLTRTEPEE